MLWPEGDVGHELTGSAGGNLSTMNSKHWHDVPSGPCGEQPSVGVKSPWQPSYQPLHRLNSTAQKPAQSLKLKALVFQQYGNELDLCDSSRGLWRLFSSAFHMICVVAFCREKAYLVVILTPNGKAATSAKWGLA